MRRLAVLLGALFLLKGAMAMDVEKRSFVICKQPGRYIGWPTIARAADGRLIFNVFDPRLDIISAHSGPLGEALKLDCAFVHPDTGRRVIVWDTRQYDPGRQMLEQYFIFEELSDEGQVIRKTYSPLTLRYVYRYEMQYLLELCGFKIEALYGDFERRTFGYGGEQIWIARKR